MQELESMLITPVWSILSKGKSGTGKTIASCGKEFRPVFVLDFDGRMRSVYNYYKRLDGHCKEVYFDSFGMNAGFYNVKKKMDELVAKPSYRTVSCASLTSYIHLVLKHAMTGKEGQTRASGQSAGKTIAGIKVNELEDFNAEDAAIIYELINFFTELKNQGVNVILEAHISPYEMSFIENKQRQTLTVNQILTKGKKAPAQIPGYFDEVWNFNKEFEGWTDADRKAKYTFTTMGTPTDDAKTSNGITGFDWTDLDLSVELLKQITNIKDNPRVDPSLPKKVAF